ncbi:RagB/SusD family nutrient uptake outer membrane protein [Aquimarina sp. RZ0]|uniref:RagB/SusD family nutrient uptake outer membrane protein n=1 Tax=Aquimarina sp. RZ0 TaxID=2607730 RepID=UPI0011F2F171|nr:RagB/SusD family nutrient uptake outer membrane protein [Aquimarina sp. RZ0]KAA1245144.1 RagB/SusD family nutrient uptake outer membrane protein [Aquimarina sp. RZ0]
MRNNIPHKFWKAVIIFLIIIFSGCSSDDNQVPSPEPDTSTIISIDELKTKVDELYVDLAKAMGFNNFFASSWAGDDITTSYNSSKCSIRTFDTRILDCSESVAYAIWTESYAIIEKTNIIIINAERLEIDDTAVKDLLTGEAYFVRGLMYHHLVRMFGNIPIQLGIELDKEVTLSEMAAVYKQIEKDWLAAEKLLPILYPDVQSGAPQPNKGTASSFLSRLYMDWAGFPVRDESKYTLAAGNAKKVMDNHISHGFDLMENLDDLWSLEHRFNKESIFTVVYCTSCEYANFKKGILGLPSVLEGWNEIFGEIRFFEDFPEGHRKNATYITDPTIEDPHTNPETQETIHWTDFDQPNPIIAKVTGKGDIPRTFTTDRNDFLMRYAEVLLIYAEASGRVGSETPEAWEALNRVKRRAELAPATIPNTAIDVTSGNLAELAFTERKWEFAGEFIRWYDLVRMERVAEVLNPAYRNNITSTYINPDSPRYGETVEEYAQITGSLETDNYFTPIAESIKAEYPNL